jgi:nifR3 family TIM-barrel protein
MWKIGDVEIKNRIVAAPLAGISNPVYRTFMHERGAGLTVSEMISDKALHYKNEKTFDMCRTSPREHPVSLQLFGNDPVTMGEASAYLTENTDCDIIDINMGCPVQKVLKAKAGSYLMAHPDEAYAVMKAVVDHTDRPVTVKMRAGWDHDHINCLEIAMLAEKAGIKAVAVHGRTRSQMYSGHSDNSYIRTVKENVSIPVIGNGDIRCADDAARMLAETGCDAVMIGRGLIGHPYLIDEIKAGMNGKSYQDPSYETRLDDCEDYARRLCLYETEKIGIREMRGLASYYITGIPFASGYKNRFSQMHSMDEFHRIMNEYREQLAVLKKPL